MSAYNGSIYFGELSFGYNPETMLIEATHATGSYWIREIEVEGLKSLVFEKHTGGDVYEIKNII